MHSGAHQSDGKERIMSQLFLRSGRGLAMCVVISATCWACGSDQKQPNSPDDTSASPAPASTGTVPSPNEVTSPPNGQPTDIPPTNPPPQSLNEPARDNAVAMPGAATAPAPQLSQAQIAKVTDLANSGEVEQAKIAQTKAKASSVKKFAAMMIKHHTDARNEQAKLYKQLDLTPSTSQTATLLQADSDKALGKLRAADGSAFDLTYMEGQVDAHQKVLDTIDRELLPAATDQSVVSALNKMRATVESHLTEAKRIVAELGKSSG
jgi:putative membrane protein